MSMLEIGGMNLFGEPTDLDFLVPLDDDSPDDTLKLFSFESPSNSDMESNLPNSLGGSGHVTNDMAELAINDSQQYQQQPSAPNSTAEVVRKRSATSMPKLPVEASAEHEVKLTEKEVNSWFFDGDNSQVVNPSLLNVTGPPPNSNSPNPRFKKKVKGGWDGRDDLSVEEAYAAEDDSELRKMSPPQQLGMSPPAKGTPLRSPMPRTPSYGIDQNSLEATAYTDSARYASMLTSNPVSSPYAPSFNSMPVKAEQYAAQAQRTPTYGAVPTRRRSVPGARGNPPFPPNNQYLFKENGQQPRPDTQRQELDANFAKVQLMEMGYPIQKKDPKSYCQQVVQFICNYCKIFVGGFYLNNNSQSQATTAPWILSCSFPSPNEFNQYFHYNVGERFIMQAAVEKRCFCVHSSSWENNNGLLSFLFVPIPNESSAGNALAVMVLGTILSREEDLHAHLLFLDQVRRPIAQTLRTLLHIQHNLFLLQKLDVFQYEGDQNKQVPSSEKALVNVLGALQINVEEYAIISTNLKGMITYFSPGAQRLLGYTAEELIGKHSLVQLHELIELNERSKELEMEFQRPCPADFNVLIQRTVANRGADDTRLWHWVKKDRSLANVQMTIRPMNDESSVFGFLAIAKEYIPQGQDEMRLDEGRK